MEGSSLVAALSTPLTLPASVVGALAVLFIILAALAIRRDGPPGVRVLLPAVALLIAASAVVSVLDRMQRNEDAAARRAIEAREVSLKVQTLAPGSALGCLDSAAGETVDSACENAVFADPQSTAAAVAYISARLTLLAEALDVARENPSFADHLAGLRRAIELDRFGIAAHVLSSRDGCTADHCAAFSLLRDASAIKANLRANAYDEYIARHAVAWKSGAPPTEKPPPVVSNEEPAAPTPSPAVAAGIIPQSPPSPTNPVPSRYDFPSAASIPPVSIMNAEPPLPAGASAANAAAPPPATAETGPKVPVPPRRPQIQAESPPAAR